MTAVSTPPHLPRSPNAGGCPESSLAGGAGAEVRGDTPPREWERRKRILVEMLERARDPSGGRHDCVIGVSGGKDSYTMLDILLQLQRKAPVSFSITAVNLDQKQPGFPEHVLPRYLESIGVDYRILEQDTYSVVTRVVPEGKTLCSLCSRLRRGALYAYAEAEGFTKIALGHHRDDLVNTFFLNLFFHAKLSGMPPKLLSDDGKHVVIRPLAYVRESDIEAYAAAKRFPIIPCNLCGSQDGLKRDAMTRLLDELEKATAAEAAFFGEYASRWA